MADNNQTDENQNTSLRPSRSRVVNPGNDSPPSDESSGTSRPEPAMRRDNVIQPLPDNGKAKAREEMFRQASDEDHVSAPVNTTTIPGSMSGVDGNRSQPSRPEPESPQSSTPKPERPEPVVPAPERAYTPSSETGNVSSHMPSQQEQPANNPDIAVPATEGHNKSNRTAVIVLVCLLLLTVLLGVAWVLLVL